MTAPALQPIQYADYKKIRVGLVGCGRISNFHFEALSRVPSYELVAVADIVEERANSAATRWKATPYGSIDQLLDSEKLDLVVLATPSGMHPLQARKCADARVACLSEKPFGVWHEEAKQVVDYFDSKNVPLFVVKQNRYNPTVAQVRRWFDRGILGRLLLIQANVFWQRPQSYYSAETWRGKRDSDGGAFMNQASHYLDLLQWFGGPIDRVQSELGTLGRDIECEDTGAAVIRFKNQAMGVVAVSMLTYPENMEGSLTLLCEKATIKISGKALNHLEVCRAESPEVGVDPESISYSPATVYGNGHQEYYKELIRFLGEPNHPEAITGREGLKSLKLICDIYTETDRVMKGNKK